MLHARPKSLSFFFPSLRFEPDRPQSWRSFVHPPSAFCATLNSGEDEDGPRSLLPLLYRDRLKGVKILLSNSQAEQLSKSRKKFLAPFSRSLYLDSNLRLQKMDQTSQTDNRKLGSSLLTRHWSNTCALVRRIIKNRSRGRSESLSYRLYP